MAKIYLDYKQNILDASNAIDRNIVSLSKDDPFLCASNILGNIRNLLDGIIKNEYISRNPSNKDRDELRILREALKFLTSINKMLTILRFYHFINIVAAHVTQNDFSSLMLVSRYSDYLHDVKDFCQKEYGLDILPNLYLFPFEEIGKEREDFYSSIENSLFEQKVVLEEKSLFYIEKRKRIKGNKNYFYEYVLSTVTDDQSKYDRLTVYSEKNINTNHSISCTLGYGKCSVGSHKVKIFYILDYKIEIMPREFNKFMKLAGSKTTIKTSSKGYSILMNYLTLTGFSVFEVASSSDIESKLNEIFGKENNSFRLFFKTCNNILNNKHKSGYKTLTYLLYTFKFSLMRQAEIKWVFDNALNEDLCFLSNACLPFEQDPFCFNPRSNNTSLYDLLMCLPEFCTGPSLLKRRIRNSIELDRKLYTEIELFGDKEKSIELSKNYNKKLPQYFVERNEEILVILDKYFTIKNYEENVSLILNGINSFILQKHPNYQRAADLYINTLTEGEIDENKIAFLRKGFSDTSVIIINGAAGTGKTTLIKHFIQLLANHNFLFLTFTHSALQNLKRRVLDVIDREKCLFYTFEYAKYANNISNYDCLIIDECSTVPNESMTNILTRGNFKFIILVGDETQIQSIKFGNWFSLAIKLFPEITSNLEIVHRSSSPNLKTLWDLTRDMNEDLFEKMQNISGLVRKIDQVFTDTQEPDEIILCLNYDGPYGVNNINRYMQDKNEEDTISWNVWTFKKNDPIIFNGCAKYGSYFYNNQKGKILDIHDKGNDVYVTVGIDIANNNNKESNDFIRYQGNDGTFDKYLLHILKNISRDDDTTYSNIVPFQLAYAVSIHKSQGLEYDSVKVILTDEVDDIISHNIFYTAITRSKNKLVIYTYTKSLGKIINNFKRLDFSKELNLLRARNKIH